MGWFYTLYYVIMAASPLVAGAWADAIGSGRAAFHYGALVEVACIALLVLFRIIARRPA